MSKDTQQHGSETNVDDVIIVGSGLNGLMLALTLAGPRCHVRVIDRGGVPTSDAVRTTTINPASYRHLNTLHCGDVNLWDDYAKRHHAPTPIAHIRVSDAFTKPQPGRLINDSLIDWHEGEDGAPLAYTFQNKAMVDSLYALASQHKQITITSDCVVTEYAGKHPDLGDAAAMIAAEDGRQFAARLIIAADGSRSPIRQMAGLKGITRHPGQTAIVAIVRCEKHHEHMAWQRFIDGGPAALMPIDDDRGMSLVWTVKDDHADTLLKADPHSFNAALMESFGPGLGALSLESERLSWPLTLHHTLKPYAQRLVLAGDAAHAIHPLAGQGYNLGVGDAAALAQLIQNAQKVGQDIGSIHLLRRYSRMRLADVGAMTVMTDGLNAAFSFAGQSPIGSGVAAVAGMGMTLFGASPLKKWAEKIARG